jgi:uncharacterized protein DUF1580
MCFVRNDNFGNFRFVVNELETKMIDLEFEVPLTLKAATKLRAVQRNGHPPHFSAIYRWCTTGVRGVVLESIVVAGSRCVTREAVDRWISALTAQADGESPSVRTRTPIRRQRDQEKAERELTDGGW